MRSERLFADTNLFLCYLTNDVPEQAEAFERLLQAVLWHVEKNVDFSDAYNAGWIMAQGLTNACTFDRRHFARFEGRQLYTPGSDPD